MAHLSILRRVQIIKRKFNIERKFCDHTLIAVYKRHGISYQRPQYSYQRKIAQSDRLRSQ